MGAADKAKAVYNLFALYMRAHCKCWCTNVYLLEILTDTWFAAISYSHYWLILKNWRLLEYGISLRHMIYGV